MQGARRGTRSRVSRIAPQAAGGAEPLRHPGCPAATFRAFDGHVWLVATILDAVAVERFSRHTEPC